MKKIIHFSDLHLRLYKDHDLYVSILNNALEEWAKIKPWRIVFTGDLVHSKNQLTPELISVITWLLTECTKICKMVIIPGNHDALINNMDRMDSLTPIVHSLDNPDIMYFKNRGIYEDENVSWCVYSQFQGNIPPEIHEAKGMKIGLFHGPIQGLVTDLGFDFGDHGYEIEKFNGLDIVLCGDIHRRSTFNISNGKRGVMIGSLIQQNHSEYITNHGYGVYDIDTDDYSFVDLVNPKPFLTFKINSFDDINNDGEQFTNYQ